jgi:hypothetical protein
MDDLVDDTGTATETRASLKRSVDDSMEVPSQGDAKRAKVETTAPAMAMELDRGMITENELRQAFATRPTISTNELVAVFHSRIEGRLPQVPHEPSCDFKLELEILKFVLVLFSSPTVQRIVATRMSQNRRHVDVARVQRLVRVSYLHSRILFLFMR